MSKEVTPRRLIVDFFSLIYRDLLIVITSPFIAADTARLRVVLSCLRLIVVSNSPLLHLRTCVMMKSWQHRQFCSYRRRIWHKLVVLIGEMRDYASRIDGMWCMGVVSAIMVEGRFC